MTITKDQFLAMPTTDYSAARDDLRTGDILLFHSTEIGSQLIEMATNSLWSHAAFIWRVPSVDRVLLLESLDTVGVRAIPMSTRVNGNSANPTPYKGRLLVSRHADFPEDPGVDKLRAMTEFALDRVGYPYSFAELHQIAFRIALGFAGKIVSGRIDQKDQFICSEYLAKCFEAVGIKIAPDIEGFIAPADIANDPKVVAKFSLATDPG